MYLLSAFCTVTGVRTRAVFTASAAGNYGAGCLANVVVVAEGP